MAEACKQRHEAHGNFNNMAQEQRNELQVGGEAQVRIMG